MTKSLKAALIATIKKARKVNDEFLNSLSIQQLTTLEKTLSKV